MIALNHFVGLCKGDYSQLELIVNQAIIKGWKGLYTLVIDTKIPVIQSHKELIQYIPDTTQSDMTDATRQKLRDKIKELEGKQK